MRWGVFLAIYILQIALTIKPFATTCKKPTLDVWLNYFSHHALDVFQFWSFLFLTTRVEFLAHFLTAIGVGIHWFTNKNTCMLTNHLNDRCGFPRDQWFDSIKNRLGLRAFSEYFLFYWLGVLMIQDLYVLSR